MRFSLTTRSLSRWSAHLRSVGEQGHRPLGMPVEYDVFHFQHQIPGGMLSNLHFLL